MSNISGSRNNRGQGRKLIATEDVAENVAEDVAKEWFMPNHVSEEEVAKILAQREKESKGGSLTIADTAQIIQG